MFLRTLLLILLGLSLNFFIVSYQYEDFYGFLFSFFILTVAAAESAIGLAIIIIYYRLKGNIYFDKFPVLKN